MAKKDSGMLNNIVNHLGLTFLSNKFINFKTRSGEDIIAIERSETADTVIIQYPMSIEYTPFHNGIQIFKIMMGFPWLTNSENRIFTINKSDILFSSSSLKREAILFYADLVLKHELGEFITPPESATETKPQTVEYKGNPQKDEIAEALYSLEEDGFEVEEDEDDEDDPDDNQSGIIME